MKKAHPIAPEWSGFVALRKAFDKCSEGKTPPGEQD